jgi:hypothetical protein
MMPTTTERLLETAQALPEPLLAEVLDFAEFLRARHARAASGAGGLDLLDLCGGLECSETFQGAPELIQRRLRDAWH